MKPVAGLAEALSYRDSSGLVAGERGGQKVTEADLGNSPLPFLQRRYAGYHLILTTSNGTQALQWVKGAQPGIVIGSFLNATAVARYLAKTQADVLLVCAGRHGAYSLEDAMLAGYLIAQIDQSLRVASDAALSTAAMYRNHADHWQHFLYQGAHAQYLRKMGKTADIEFAFRMDAYPFVPELAEDRLIADECS